MISALIWWACIVAEAAILVRAFRAGMLGKFPFFYLYIASLLFTDVPLYFVYVFDRGAYPYLNWDAGLLNLVLGCGILLEVFRHGLLPYPGAERFARIAGLSVFLVIFGVLVICLAAFPGIFQSSLMNNSLERNLLAVQGIFLCCLMAIIRYYRIVLSKNIRGMILGYGLCIGLTLSAIAVRLYAGTLFNAAWLYIQPLSYFLCLLLWARSLWRYEPVPALRFEAPLIPDYEAFATTTKGTMEAMRSNLGRAARP